MFSKELFGTRVLERLREKGMMQKHLSDMLHCDHSTVTKLITGSRGASAEMLFAMAEILEISVDYLMGRTDIPEVNHSRQQDN
ncbi:hypothetical protein AGMMS49992_22060 [Clostridia bacterium]|nr:hypothetical protein AGMMS49992_22060 [Clostridia bacterium]